MAEAIDLTRDVILGTWRMLSWTYQVVGSSTKQDALGSNPNGCIVYTPERVMVLVLKPGRKKPAQLVPTPEEKIALYDTMLAYSGTYTVHRDRVVHHLDMSWNEAWSGTEQVRFCTLHDDRLTYTSAPSKNPLDGKEVTHEVIFEKVRAKD